MKKESNLMIAATLLIAALLFSYVPRAEPYIFESQILVGTTDQVETTLDPAHAYDYFGWEIIRALGAGLVDYAPGATGPQDVIPDLATSWSTSLDGLQWTFTLRQGAKYDDGTEFNATHVKYTFDRDIGMADPNSAFVALGFADIIQNVTVMDTYTVRFYLNTPYTFFLALLAGEESVMVDPTYAPMYDTINYTEGNPRASNPLGLGPYTLTNWTRAAGKDIVMKLVANPNYWNATGGFPRTKNIIIQFYATSSSLTLAIENGEVDVAYRQLSITDIKTMQNNVNLHVWQGPGSFIQYLCFQERYAPFNATDIRKAVGAAINRSLIVNTVFQGQAQELYSMIPIGMFAHEDVFQTLGDPNYTRTQELLAPYGYNATDKLTFTLWYETSGHYPQSPQMAEVLKYSIEASGVITVNLAGLEWAAMGAARRAGTMQAFIYGWYPDYIDPDDYIQPFLETYGASWLNLGYSNPEMDELIALARQETSNAERNSLYEQIQTLMVTDSPIIPLYQAVGYAVSTSNITGIYLDISRRFRYEYLETPTESYETLHFHPAQDTYGYTMSVLPATSSITASYTLQDSAGPVFSSPLLITTHDFSGMQVTLYHDLSISDRSITLVVGWIDAAGAPHIFMQMDSTVISQSTHTDISIPGTFTVPANQRLYLQVYKNEYTGPVTIFWGDSAHDSSFSYLGTVNFIPEYQSVLVFLIILLAIAPIVVVCKRPSLPLKNAQPS